MNATTLRACWRMGCLHPEQLPAIAADLLLQGTDSRGLRELAGLHHPSRAEVEPVLERAFREMGIPRLDDDVACRLVAGEIASRALAGTLPPYDAAAVLAGLSAGRGHPDHLTPFVAALDDWDDVPEAREEVENDIVEACRRLVAALASGT